VDTVEATAARIADGIERARRTNPRPEKLGDILQSVEEVTVEWLTAVLQKTFPGVVVTDVRVEAVSAGTQHRHRLHVTYLPASVGEPAAPSTLFTKSLPTVESRMIAGITGHAKTEGRFYTDLRPHLDLEVPVCYHSTVDPETFAAVHVLDDLTATRGAEFCDASTSVTLGMAEAMVDLMATYHAQFFGDPRFGDELRWLARYHRWFLGGIDKLHVDQYHEEAMTAAADRIPDRLLGRRDEVWPATLAALRVHETEPPTLLHSDVHIGNWYRTADGSMGLCDWQCAAQGHWSRDLAYALSAALRVDDRRSWEEGLVRRYLERRLELDGHDPGFDDTWRWYRQQMLHALLMWTPTLSHSEHLPHMQPDWISLAMIERMTAAIDDLQSIDAVDR
jgi:aminoglycoside phosphotransferase (APT) family kinase protein